MVQFSRLLLVMLGALISTWAFAQSAEPVLARVQQERQPYLDTLRDLVSIESGSSDVEGLSGENIYALCDVDTRQADSAFNAYPSAKKYRDWREMLEKERRNIDAVMISTPDHTHAVIGMAALAMR